MAVFVTAFKENLRKGVFALPKSSIPKWTNSMEIREKQIEDILVSSPSLVQRTFGLDEEPRLIGRQIAVPSGRLDMLYTYQKDLFLIELKVATFQKKFIKQVLDYKKDLQKFQVQGKLVGGDIVPFLLMPHTSSSNRNEIEVHGVILQEYNPEDILSFFYSERLRPITTFSELKPVDVGIWNIHLVNKFIYELTLTNSITELRQIVGGSSKTLYNKIRFANELGLLNWSKSGDYIALSRLGEQYVAAKDKYLDDTLNEDQAKLLKDYVMQNPYDSCINLGIASMVECVFTLAKTFYPVPLEQLEQYFATYSGKSLDWQTPRAKMYGAKMYSNYAIDLGLLAKNDNSVYLTPEGFKFVIQMQLHKSLKLMNYLNIN